ncbi:DUF6074 family protein [Neorhizobium galegae]|uniref:DUF6074 family protein n=1 Tax=Neorhizobium galegae TaxID=399 RepID=UPI001F36A9C8|nr:DUF6074 family protein [Neorhizobium galegae]UIK05028.1 DUF6074 family protein [Neorhizobium galegae]
MTNKCQMIAFPLSRRIGKVRRVAEVFARKTGRERASYWKSQVATLWDQLHQVGFADDEISELMDGFRDAVESEINRRAYEGRSDTNPKGAA